MPTRALQCFGFRKHGKATGATPIIILLMTCKCQETNNCCCSYKLLVQNRSCTTIKDSSRKLLAFPIICWSNLGCKNKLFFKIPRCLVLDSSFVRCFNSLHYFLLGRKMPILVGWGNSFPNKTDILRMIDKRISIVLIKLADPVISQLLFS